jgi:hypothetical protein
MQKYTIIGLICIAIVLIILYFLFKIEYQYQDCIPGKNCVNKVESTKSKNPKDIISNLYDMIRNNYTFVIWRNSLIAGLIVTLPIVYYLTNRMPTIWDWIFIPCIVFIATYSSQSWLWYHYLYPNSRQIEQNLLYLHDNLEQDNHKHTNIDKNKFENTKSDNNLLKKTNKNTNQTNYQTDYETQYETDRYETRYETDRYQTQYETDRYQNTI